MSTRHLRGGVLLAAAAFVVLLTIWAPVLTGQRVMIGGDVLYEYLPWSNEPGAHGPANTLMSDAVVQDLVWQTVVARDIGAGRLPLWNQDVGSGTPFLANDQPGVLSPFTWIAMALPPATGLSIAMLVKLLVAGIGMAFFLRVLGTNGTAAAFGGVAFASSSFMADWLAWPIGSVAAFTPWLFGFVEVHLQHRRPWALPALAIIVAMQFFGGHAETSFHLALGAGIYTAVRWAATGRSLWALIGLGAAVITGTLLAGIQLAPFVDFLRRASLVGIRVSSGYGHAHLNLAAITSWAFPNAVGNPGIDGMPGRPPDFNESTGFAGVGALVLAPVGIWSAWHRMRSVVVALAAVGVVAAGAVYGALSPLTASLPGFQVTNNERMLLLLCFCVAAVGGIGLDSIMRAQKPALSIETRPWLALGTLALGASIGATVLALATGERVETLLPHYHNYIGFWLVTGAISLTTAVSFAVAGLGAANGKFAISGLCILALVEGAFYVASFDRTVPASEVPPASPAMAWLTAHADGHPVAAVGQDIVPESAVLYGLSDVREYEILMDPREAQYWSAADPGFTDARAYMQLDRPGVDWLSAAGVAYVMTRSGGALPGTSIVYDSGGVTIAAVPDPRPFAYAATEVSRADSPETAAAQLSRNPIGPVVLEGCCSPAGQADVRVVERADGEVRLDVSAQSAATIVVNQAYESGWSATVDGRSAPMVPANVLFMAVPVPAGHHVVDLYYRPVSVVAGGFASGAGALLLVVFVLMAARRPASRAPRNQ